MRAGETDRQTDWQRERESLESNIYIMNVTSLSFFLVLCLPINPPNEFGIWFGRQFFVNIFGALCSSFFLLGNHASSRSKVDRRLYMSNPRPSVFWKTSLCAPTGRRLNNLNQLLHDSVLLYPLRLLALSYVCTIFDWSLEQGVRAHM